MILALVIVSLYIVANSTGFLKLDNAQAIGDVVAQSGLLGVLIYCCIFSIGQLLHVPGMVFVAAAALAFGKSLGLVYAMVGAATAITVVFFVVRTIGGTALANPESPWVRRAVSRLETQPFKSILLMRLVFSTGPWLNYVLAMSTVSYPHYITASLLGIFPQVLITIYLADSLVG